MLPSLEATPRNEKIRPFLGREKEKKKQTKRGKNMSKQASSVMTGTGTSPLSVVQPRSWLQLLPSTGTALALPGTRPRSSPAPATHATTGVFAKPRCSAEACGAGVHGRSQGSGPAPSPGQQPQHCNEDKCQPNPEISTRLRITESAPLHQGEGARAARGDQRLEPSAAATARSPVRAVSSTQERSK